MKWPFFMSREYWYLKGFETYEAALNALKEKDLDHIADFYIESCEDRTWITSGGTEVMEPVLSWLVEAYHKDLLDPEKAKAVAEAIQSQHKALEPTIAKDVDFVIEDQTISVSSFMFSAQSPFFRDLIRRTKTRKARKTIEMPKIKLRFFDFIKEFIDTGRIEYLWREEPKYILNFIRQSQKLGLERMTAFASEVYKRYLTKDNVIPHMQLAQKEFLKDLERECCRFINEQNYGITLNFQPGEGLEVVLDRLLEVGIRIIAHLNKQISTIVCRKAAAEDARLIDLIQSIPRLVGLDLSETSGVSDELLETFPSVKQLNLAGCEWLDDDTFLTIVNQTKDVIKLNLSKNTDLTFRSWGGLATLTQLIHLDLSYCDQMDDDDVDLMASSCPRLAELILKFTPLTDKGLSSIAKQCQALAYLNASDCRNLRGEGLVDLGGNVNSLETLDLTNCRKIDSEYLNLFHKALPAAKVIGQD